MRLSNNSLATEKCWFRQFSEQLKEGVNHQKQVKGVGGKIGFGGLGKIFEGSLATARPVFRWLKGDIWRGHNPSKASFTRPFGNKVSVA